MGLGIEQFAWREHLKYKSHFYLCVACIQTVMANGDSIKAIWLCHFSAFQHCYSMQNHYTYNTLAIHITTVVMFKEIQWHAVPGKWAENNTGTAEQVFHLILAVRGKKRKKKIRPEMKLSFASVRLNQSSTPYLRSLRCKPHQRHRSHCWQLPPLLLRIGSHALKERMRTSDNLLILMLLA